MAEVRFTVTVTVPDEQLDADGRIVGSEQWSETARRPQYGAVWVDGREPVEHYAARMLVAHAASSQPGVRADVQLKR